MYCDGCDFDKRHESAKAKPFSFLRSKGHSQAKWRLRRTDMTVARLNYAFDKISAIGKRKAYLRKFGLRATLKSVYHHLHHHQHHHHHHYKFACSVTCTHTRTQAYDV